MVKEQRIYAAAQIRAAGDEGALVGYAAIFEQYSQLLPGGFKERIKKGAFRKVLRAKPDTKFLINHDVSMLLGRTTNGTLEMNEDDKGLKFRVKLPMDVSYARDVYALVKRGDMSQCSFAFSVDPEGQSWGEDWEDDSIDGSGRRYFPAREVSDVSALYDLSVVTEPAYTQTSVAARDFVPSEVRSIVERLNAAHRVVVAPAVNSNVLSEADAEGLRAYLRSMSPW